MTISLLRPSSFEISCLPEGMYSIGDCTLRSLNLHSKIPRTYFSVVMVFYKSLLQWPRAVRRISARHRNMHKEIAKGLTRVSLRWARESHLPIRLPSAHVFLIRAPHFFPRYPLSQNSISGPFQVEYPHFKAAISSPIALDIHQQTTPHHPSNTYFPNFKIQIHKLPPLHKFRQPSQRSPPHAPRHVTARM